MRKAVALLLATAVYALLISSILYLTHSFKKITSPSLKVTKISLVSFDKANDKASDTVNSEKIEEKRSSEIKKEKKPLKEKKIKNKEKIIKKEVQKKIEKISKNIADTIAKKKIDEPKKKTKAPKHKTAQKRQKEIKKHIKPQTANSKKSIRRRARRGGGNLVKLASLIRRRIERHKRYPPSAKRRNIQGRVRVSFTLNANGTVSNIKVTGKSIFKSYAKKAVKAAFPINVSRLRVRLPHRFTLTLIYRLR